MSQTLELKAETIEGGRALCSKHSARQFASSVMTFILVLILLYYLEKNYKERRDTRNKSLIGGEVSKLKAKSMMSKSQFVVDKLSFSTSLIASDHLLDYIIENTYKYNRRFQRSEVV